MIVKIYWTVIFALLIGIWLLHSFELRTYPRCVDDMTYCVFGFESKEHIGLKTTFLLFFAVAYVHILWPSLLKKRRPVIFTLAALLILTVGCWLEQARIWIQTGETPPSRIVGYDEVTSGKGACVAAAPSPKNRTCKFPCIRLKPSDSGWLLCERYSCCV
ncbi:MAG: hypothetical protein AB7V06_28095, partial [Candidatus Obscuribacterales bacterium]